MNQPNDLFQIYKKCNLCPRQCNIDRTISKGFCGENENLSIDSALLHFGEEPPISFKNGSGTIFFTGCSLRCPFCQNMQLSQDAKNKKFYSMEAFIRIIEKLIEKGATNINFVTPDHFMPHIIEAIKIIKDKGYDIPFIYNCSGYQSLDHLEKIIDYIDIFLFDYKFADAQTAKYCVGIDDYPDIAYKGLEYIYRKKGNLTVDEKGKGLKGVIIRHLVLPGFVKNSIDVLNNIYFSIGNKVYISLMSQYTPVYLKKGYEKLNRKITRDEYNEVVEMAVNLGFNNGFIQDYIDAEDKYIPDFKSKNLFDVW